MKVNQLFQNKKKGGDEKVPKDKFNLFFFQILINLILVYQRPMPEKKLIVLK